MGTLMRSPAARSTPRRLALPGRPAATRPASVPPLPTSDSGAEAHDGQAAAPAVDVSATQARAARAEARCAELDASLDELREDLAARRDAAREAGHAEGVERGRAEAREEMAERAGRLDALLAAIDAAYKDALDGHEDEIVEAVFAATGKIIGKRMATRRGAAAATRQACRQIDNRRKLVVRVAPDDLDFLGADDVLGSALGGSAKFEPDAGVALGGCVVETAGGTLDARLETQLESLRRVLLRARDKRAAEAPAPARPSAKARK